MQLQPDRDVSLDRAPCSIDEVPQEILDIIIDALWADITTLKCCSLTCRRWLPRSSKALFALRVFSGGTSKPGTAFLAAVQLSERIQLNVAHLVLTGQSFALWRLVTALPRLRTLRIVGWRRAEGALAMPAPETTRRSIDILDLCSLPLAAADWLLHLFRNVGTVRLDDIDPNDTRFLRTRVHVARSADLRATPQILRYLADHLDGAALENLKLEVIRAGDETSCARNFIEKVGQNLRTYHNVHSELTSTTLVPPALSALDTLTSVTLTSEARGRRAQDLAFLKSLPRNVARLKIVYGHHGWRDDAALAKGFQHVDWAALGDTIVPRGRIECLEIGVVRLNQLSNFAPLPKNTVACAAVLGKLSEELRRIVKFV
ncbi:hypothetical protein PsYK624_112780 [Phanerochaete sordida]|uniref:F-box domain-containing protein n=1 Tax=Phanerochaete sordida TaxID=48140 RepID=A0A9P3LHL6_9APHY|nr:hypothetical protein PsYK624_112780 [Phanerochaete sordida]